MVEKEYCPICQRIIKTDDMTIHHHQPKSLGGTLDDTMRICKCCHENLHYYIDIEVVSLYDTIELLETHPRYKRYIEFIRTVEHDAMYRVKDVKHKIKSKKQLAA